MHVAMYVTHLIIILPEDFENHFKRIFNTIDKPDIEDFTRISDLNIDSPTFVVLNEPISVSEVESTTSQDA